MGDMEKNLPDEVKGGTLWPGNELVLPHAEASSAVGIATEHQIAVLGFEAFKVQKDALLTVDYMWIRRPIYWRLVSLCCRNKRRGRTLD